MDNRLVLAVLLVTLSWMSMGAYAQSNETVVNNNATSTTNATSGTNMTTESNATSTTNATSGTNMTTESNATSTTNATSGTNMTTESNATSTTNATSGTNMTTESNATSTTNATTATNMTTAPNATEATNTTAAPATAAPLTPNTTVETLQTTITNTGCGSEQLCAAQPASCDPADTGSCFFLSAKQQSGQNYDFELSGESEGYIALSLSTDSTLGDNDTTYVCANDNGVVKFFSTLLNNGQLTQTVLNVNSVKGSVNGTKIQCTFAATVPSSTTTRTTNLALAISNGPFNSSSGALGSPTTQLQSAVLDLSNPNTTVTNEILTNSTAAPTTTSHAVTLQQSLTQALLLISASVLGLAML